MLYTHLCTRCRDLPARSRQSVALRLHTLAPNHPVRADLCRQETRARMRPNRSLPSGRGSPALALCTAQRKGRDAHVCSPRHPGCSSSTHEYSVEVLAP